MILFPAIDLKNGQCVRLEQGDMARATVFNLDPAAQAKTFETQGFEYLHVVDLDGAFSGAPSTGLLERLVRVGVPVQVGGGYRTLPAIETAVATGADRVMVGTAALDASFLAAAIARVGAERLVVAIDARAGRVAVDGWARMTEVTPALLARQAADSGVARFLVTSASRDGSLEGPDLSLLVEVIEAGVPVLAAGGVSSVEDLRHLREIGCEGAIAGSALLAGRFTIAEAIAATTG